MGGGGRGNILSLDSDVMLTHYRDQKLGEQALNPEKAEVLTSQELPLPAGATSFGKGFPSALGIKDIARVQTDRSGHVVGVTRANNHHKSIFRTEKHFLLLLTRP
jgi:hypothetical protein